LALVGVNSVHSGLSWIIWDVIWGIAGAVVIGGLLGCFAAQYMLHLRLVHDEKLGTDNFLALGLMGLSYGVASAAHTIGYVAVFAARVAVREMERHMDDEPPNVHGRGTYFRSAAVFRNWSSKCFPGLTWSGFSGAEQSIAGFFGTRGMASVYYVAYLYRKGVPASLLQQLDTIVFGVVAYSILLHGTSATPVTGWFEKRSTK
jgi:sodium/hydrogen antiporter